MISSGTTCSIAFGVDAGLAPFDERARHRTREEIQRDT